MLDEKYINQLIEQMDQLGYFKFSKKEDVEEIREDLWFGFKIKSLNCTLDEELMSIGKEKRYFMIDHLSIMEKDFIPFLLEEIEPTIQLLGFDIQEIENKKFSNYKTKIAYIIDEINKIIVTDSSTSEQFYLVNKDDELACYLLTPALQMILETHFEDKNDHPLSPQDWLDFYTK